MDQSHFRWPGSDRHRLADRRTLSQLPVRLALPGHGPAISDPAKTFAAARSRYERMRADPQRAGWHACKRIFAFALMIHDGIPLGEVTSYLTSRAWLADHATAVFGTDADPSRRTC